MIAAMSLSEFHTLPRSRIFASTSAGSAIPKFHGNAASMRTPRFTRFGKLRL